jgi:hypothetical protein
VSACCTYIRNTYLLVQFHAARTGMQVWLRPIRSENRTEVVGRLYPPRQRARSQQQW